MGKHRPNQEKRHRNFLLFAGAVRHATSSETISKYLDLHVTEAQTDALRFLFINEHVSVGELAAGLGYTVSGATKAVNRLEDKGWVIRHPCLEDHREVHVSLTDEGGKIAAKIMQVTQERLDELFSRISPRTLSRLDCVVEEFLRGIISDERMKKQLCAVCALQGGTRCRETAKDCVVANAQRESSP